MKINRKQIFLVLSIIWMAVIFHFSNQVAEVSSGHSGGVINFIINSNIPIISSLFEFMMQIEIAEFVIRKSAHMFIYAVLATLLFFSLYEKTDSKEIYLKSMFFTFLYAVSDEYHQTFVKGRSGEIRDVFVDSFGAMIGLIIVYLVFKRLKAKSK